MKRARDMLAGFEANLTSYDMFAATVAAMIFCHFFHTFEPPEPGTLYWWSQVPAVVFLPVFLFSVGYNTGRNIGRGILGGTAVVLFARWFFFHGHFSFFPMTVLVTIIVSRLIVDRMMGFVLRSRAHFLLVNLALIAVIPPTHSYFSEYGTMGIILAMAGWLVRHEPQVPKSVVDVKEYMMLSFLLYLILMESTIFLPLSQFLAAAAGTAYVFRLLYGMRGLILNALRRKPRDMVEKICAFMGHKSLELYIAQALVFQFFLYHVLAFPPS